jgi:selenocysteine lyase/cysteine desulfurase
MHPRDAPAALAAGRLAPLTAAATAYLWAHHNPDDCAAAQDLVVVIVALTVPVCAAGTCNGICVCVRPGHHCAKPLMRVLGVGATARASWYLYNDAADIDALGDALDAARSFFSI